VIDFLVAKQVNRGPKVEKKTTVTKRTLFLFLISYFTQYNIRWIQRDLELQMVGGKI
jgi:hypothetical protein